MPSAPLDWITIVAERKAYIKILCILTTKVIATKSNKDLIQINAVCRNANFYFKDQFPQPVNLEV